MLLIWEDAVQGIRYRVLRGFFQKLRGLLGTGCEAAPVVLCGCGAIHTFGMRYALDVALVSREGLVLASVRDLPAGKQLKAKGAFYAFERPNSDEPWPTKGAKVSMEFEDRLSYEGE